MSSCNPSNPAAGPEPAATGGSGTRGCSGCTITSQTVATSPADRARTRIGVGEEVRLTVNPGPATWSITSGTGSLNPTRGSHTTVTYTADDTAGSVTITATGSGCSCTITFTVVAPSNTTMEKAPGTNLRHTNGRPDCGWKGKQWIHPDDVNFYNIERREVDSNAVCTGSYMPFNNVLHGNYPGGYGSWFGIDTHDPAKGSRAAMTDNIYSGDPGAGATGAAPPFNVGTMYFPIVYQWRVGTGTAHNFPAIRQEHEIFANGRCESRKGGNTESTMYNDPTSTP
jgi:type VI secretion system secreted protein VgrG